MKRIAVITGGGSFGAYHTGTLAALNLKFDAVFGTSTGALMAPFVALQEYNDLRTAYTSIDQYDIFDNWFNNPFKKDGKISFLKSVPRIMMRKRTLGSTKKALPKTIKKFYPESFHRKVKGKMDVLVNCVDFTKVNSSQVVYFNAKDTEYKDFLDYMRASASFPGVMSPVLKDGKELVDGGLSETGSVVAALEQQPEEVHIFIHRRNPSLIKRGKVGVSKHIFDTIRKILNSFIDEVVQNDLNEKRIKLLAKVYGVKKVHFHYMNKEYNHRLVFDKDEMNEMQRAGYYHANSSKYNKTLVIA